MAASRKACPSCWHISSGSGLQESRSAWRILQKAVGESMPARLVTHLSGFVNCQEPRCDGHEPGVSLATLQPLGDSEPYVVWHAPPEGLRWCVYLDQGSGW